MKSKIFLKIAAVAMAFGLITAFTLSYFTDSEKTSASATAGSFDIDVKSDITGKRILLPGKAYGFETTVDNIGNKSADIKMVITLETDDGAVFEGQPSIIDLYEALDENKKPSGNSLEKTVISDNTVQYSIEHSLNGNTKFGDNRETEDGISDGVWNPDVYLYIGDYSGTDASYVKMTVDFYAKQKRNTSAGWELIETYEEVAGN